MAVMDLQVSPRRIGTVSVSDAVVKAHEVIEASGLKYVLHPMGTCIEGSADELYALAASIHQALAKMGFERIGINLKLDDRRDRPQTMQDKLRRISELAGKPD